MFVAHSLGGIVVEDALLCSKNSGESHIQRLLECTVGIEFLGTPHCGSNLANWGMIFRHLTDLSRTTNILATLKPSSEVLARIQREFHTMLRVRSEQGKSPLHITCFYEETPVIVPVVGMVVPQHSAVLPGYNSVGIHKNHIDMCKFESPDDSGYRAVASQLWIWANNIALQTQNSSATLSGSGNAQDNLPNSVQKIVASSHPPQAQTLNNSGTMIQGNSFHGGGSTFNF
jgi:hypothetical protein